MSLHKKFLKHSSSASNNTTNIKINTRELAIESVDKKIVFNQFTFGPAKHILSFVQEQQRKLLNVCTNRIAADKKKCKHKHFSSKNHIL